MGILRARSQEGGDQGDCWRQRPWTKV